MQKCFSGLAKRIAAGLVMTGLLMAFVPSVPTTASTRPPAILIDGIPLVPDQPPVIVNGRTLLPLRAIFERLGAKVEWDEVNWIATATKNDTEVKVQIDNKYAQINGRWVELDVPAQVVNSRTLVPVRFVSEALGSQVLWNQDTWTVSILTNVVVTGPTKTEIKARWEELKPTYSGPAFVEQPVITAPYKAGALHPDYLQDGLNVTNFMRFLAGLDPVVLDASLNIAAQHNSVLMARTGQPTHWPTRPSDMSEDFFELAAQGAGGNLAVGPIFPTIPDTVIAYMQDIQTHNLKSVGHRRWVLNPLATKAGFGMASGTTRGTQMFYQTMVINVQDLEYDSWRHTQWPNKGYFPVEFFDKEEPWSVHINPYYYFETDMSDVTVELTCLNDGRTWHFAMESPEGVIKSNGYVYHATKYLAGSGMAVVFRPDGIGEYRDGDVFEVRVSGIKDEYGRIQSIQYQVHFFQM